MAEELPQKVDVIILGTGLPESIMAGACARSGLSVLHLDCNEYYGGLWSSFNLKGIEEWSIAKKTKAVKREFDFGRRFLADNEEFVAATFRLNVENVYCSIHSGKQKERECDMDIEQFSSMKMDVSDARRYSIDILPKLLLSRGEMVKLLCDSGVAKYCEFKCVDRFLGCFNIEEKEELSFDLVPCSRSEIFQSQFLTMLEKRKVMKFIQSCIDWRLHPDQLNSCKEFAEKSFSDFLESHCMTKNLRTLADAIGIIHPDGKTPKCLDGVCEFLNSVGRFGDSPFLWPVYGCGELSQCFCRLCAVFGGTYCLNTWIDGFVISEQRVKAVVTKEQRIECDYVISNSSYIPDELIDIISKDCIHRAIVIADASLLSDSSNKDHLSVANLSFLNRNICPRLVEVGYEACVAPKGKFVTHLTAKGSGTAFELLSPIVDRLYPNRLLSETSVIPRKPSVIWSIFFDLISTSIEGGKLPKNMFIVPDIDPDLNYAAVVTNTRQIFERIWPNLEFFPYVETLDEHESEEVFYTKESNNAEEEALGDTTERK